jgi:hypothetical protein
MINRVTLVDLTKIRRETLRDLLANMVRLQRWSGGYQAMIAEIERELKKKRRPIDQRPPDSAA